MAVQPRTVHPAVAFAIDVVLVLVFLVIGRSAHGEPFFEGFLGSAWPFLVALVVGWVAILLARTPAADVLAGVIAWIGTLVVGMVLRVVSGGTAAVPFLIVATITLAVLLIGWRLILRLVRRRRG
ncbi:DUF3054 domain-containing protein [Microbacterium sp. JZ31]|uniref:DUF3054 domain-containing protein n=1 Tax=Microbacterium sp. JZ31 TaxID=1906274 RepID=UPI00193421DF|nr:DUF3054 domain-containing protein [Microbacterium sp. JZ31]